VAYVPKQTHNPNVAVQQEKYKKNAKMIAILNKPA
jgi:hypothetical protein